MMGWNMATIRNVLKRILPSFDQQRGLAASSDNISYSLPVYNIFILIEYDVYYMNFIWANSWDHDTYHLGDQRRLRRAVQCRHNIRCSHTWSMEVDETFDQNIRHLAQLDGCTCAFEEWVYGGLKVHNLMRWLISLTSEVGAIRQWSSHFTILGYHIHNALLDEVHLTAHIALSYDKVARLEHFKLKFAHHLRHEVVVSVGKEGDWSN